MVGNSFIISLKYIWPSDKVQNYIKCATRNSSGVFKKLNGYRKEI